MQIDNREIFHRNVPRPRWLWMAVLGCALCTLQCAPVGPMPQEAQEPQESTPLVLSLSPSNPQIAPGTAQQFEVHGMQPNGQQLDLTQKVQITVTGEENTAMVQPMGGLVQLAQPGRYLVTAEYD